MTIKIKGQPIQSKAAFWQYHIEKIHGSSLSQMQYCREHVLALSTFQYWKKKLKSCDLQDKARFYPLTVQPVQPRETSPSSAGLTILVDSDEVRVDIAEEFSAPALKKLLTVLRQL